MCVLVVGFWWLPWHQMHQLSLQRGGKGALEQGRRTGNAPTIERLPLASTPPEPHYCARKQLAGKRLQNHFEVCSIYDHHHLLLVILASNFQDMSTNCSLADKRYICLIVWIFSRNLEVAYLAVAFEEQTVNADNYDELQMNENDKSERIEWLLATMNCAQKQPTQR